MCTYQNTNVSIAVLKEPNQRTAEQFIFIGGRK